MFPAYFPPIFPCTLPFPKYDNLFQHLLAIRPIAHFFTCKPLRTVMGLHSRAGFYLLDWKSVTQKTHFIGQYFEYLQSDPIKCCIDRLADSDSYIMSIISSLWIPSTSRGRVRILGISTMDKLLDKSTWTSCWTSWLTHRSGRIFVVIVNYVCCILQW